MTPQPAVHRRGGTHRVKDEDKTHTIYDDWDYKQLKHECIDRGVYVKDMKKVAMAKVLANGDREKKRAERNAIVELERRKMEREKEQEKEKERLYNLELAKRKRRLEKQRRRDRDESVSDDTPDEDELERMHNEMRGFDQDDKGELNVGDMLSDESWDSTSTETTFRSTDPHINPNCRLRVFEWPFQEVPPTEPKVWDKENASLHSDNPSECVPRLIHYVPLKVLATESKEKLFLPGQKYPPNVEPDYVPILPQQIRDGARNGVLQGVLSQAIIERGSDWAGRTKIQCWNARMYFTLPSRNETKVLADVYQKWYLENRKLLRVKPCGDGLKADRVRRHSQRHKNKVRKLYDVYDSSQYRPLLMCYLPSYLDFDTQKPTRGHRERMAERTLNRLFFIRFPGCDVPHYYFWVRAGEWADPTMTNPRWYPTSEEAMSDKSATTDHDSTCTAFVRVKKLIGSDIVQDIQPTTVLPHLANFVSDIEQWLYTDGLSATLSRFRAKWLKEGRESVWENLGCALPLLFPGGQLPTVPPVHAKDNISVAMKLADMDTVGKKTVLPPFNGNEPWTRDDDAWWDVIQIDGQNSANQPIQSPVYDNIQGPGHSQSKTQKPTILGHPSRIEIPGQGSTEKCTAWLEQLSPSCTPTSDNLPESQAEGYRTACPLMTPRPVARTRSFAKTTCVDSESDNEDAYSFTHHKTRSVNTFSMEHGNSGPFASPRKRKGSTQKSPSSIESREYKKAKFQDECLRELAD